MKLLIYFLLICNIGFVAWHFRGLDTREDGAADVLDINSEHQLILLSEFQQQQKNVKTSSDGMLCYSLGPFTKKSESKKAQGLLKAKNIETKRIR